MAKVTVVDTKTVYELAPGQTFHWKWNNAAPAQAVWFANAVPVSLSDVVKAEDRRVEVTRLWRRVIVSVDKPFPQSQTADIDVEHEIHCEVRNLGTTKTGFVVYLGVIS